MHCQICHVWWPTTAFTSQQADPCTDRQWESLNRSTRNPVSLVSAWWIVTSEHPWSFLHLMHIPWHPPDQCNCQNHIDCSCKYTGVLCGLLTWCQRVWVTWICQALERADDQTGHYIDLMWLAAVVFWFRAEVINWIWLLGLHPPSLYSGDQTMQHVGEIIKWPTTSCGPPHIYL